MSAQNIAAISALTPLQEGILFHVLKDPERRVYHSQFCATIDGPLEHQRWRDAWDRVIARHDALRTLFTWEGRDKPLQIVRQRVDTPWQELDWRHLEPRQEAQQISALMQRDRDLGFELTRAPLLRLILIRLQDGRHRFIFSFHHLILDGWSMRLVLDEAQRIYGALGRGDDARGPAAPSFTRYVEWLDRRGQDDGAFWRERLGDFTQPVFPDVADGEAAGSAAHEVCERTVDGDLYRRLTELARRKRITMSSMVSAAWALLLARYAERDDVVFGTTVAGRPPELDGADQTAGLFINTLPLRIRVDDSASLSDYLSDVHARQVALRGVEHTPLVTAQRASAVPPGEPLFETIVVFENFPSSLQTQTDIALCVDTFVEYSHFPVALLALPDDALQFVLVSDPARLSLNAARDLLDNLVSVLAGMAQDAARTIGEIAALADEQRLRVVDTFNQTEVATGELVSLWQQIADHATRKPGHVAVADKDGSVTYAELARQAERVAARLQRSGLVPGDAVIVSAPRDTRVIVGVLGILAAGGAYVPVSPNVPPARIASIARDLSKARDRVFVLAPQPPGIELPAGARHVPLDVTEDTDADSAGDYTPSEPAADALAYVIYTSGSTGEPKGVAVTHRNLFHSVDARDRYYGTAPDAFLMLSDLSTDSSVAGLFWTLGRGGTLVVAADRAEQDMAGLARVLQSERVTHLLTVPSLYALILEQLDATSASALQVAIVAGDACTPSLVESHARILPHVALHNEYGPTEATVWCSAAQLLPGQAVTIGRPLANTRLYVLDSADRPVPIGVNGELCVAGAQVAAGYYADPSRTARRFVADPFVPGARMYRTGDRVRWRRDGSLTFVGRVDQQVKVRGFRVEPGEIESRIARFPGVNEAAVVLNAGRLVAYVTASGTVNDEQLRADLAAQLPAHMVPQMVQNLDALPRTAAGKIDRGQLATMTLQSPQPAAARVEPTDDTQRTLASIWQDVLGIERVGLHDDFFALGGDSLLSIRVLARAGKAGLTISPADFFAYPTVAGQAGKVSTSPRRRPSQSPAIGPVPLLPIQRWFFEHIDRAPHHWNLSFRFELARPTSLEHLQRAVGLLLTTHDALRSGFNVADGQWQAQLAAPATTDIVTELDLSGLPGTEIDEPVVREADRLNASFDLGAPPLLRLCLVRTAPRERDQLLVVAHHLVIDVESWRIVLEDLALTLEQLAAGQSPRLPEKTDSILVWSTRLAAAADTPDMAAAAALWAGQLRQPAADITPNGALTDQDRSEGRARNLVVTLEPGETRALLAAAGPARSSVRELLLAAVASALGIRVGGAAVRIEMEGHGREALFDDVDITRTVGWLTSAFPVTVRIDGHWSDVAAVVRAAKSALRELPHNGLSFGVISGSNARSDDARIVREAARPAVLVNYLGQRSARAVYGDLALLSERCGLARSPDAPRAYLLEFNALVEDERLSATLTWPDAAFDEQEIRDLAADIVAALRALGSASSDTAVPEDFPLAGLDRKGLSDLSALLDDLDD